MKYRVMVTDKLSKKGIDELKKFSEIEVVEKDTLSAEELKKEIKDYDAVIIRSATKLTADIIQCADKLKVISRAGVGVDNIDVAAATEKGIVVMNAPSGNTISTAELTFALMISLARKVAFSYNSLKEGNWDRKSFKGVELLGKTLGVVGLGRIGTEVAKRAKAFGMDILGFDPYISEERASNLGIELATLEKIYKESDFISIHTPLTDQTRGMIGEKELAMMKNSVRIINCARGGIIDEEALAKALNEGKVAGAAIDVWSKEPPFEPRNPLLDAPNCLTIPHLGASTEEAQFYVAIESAESVANFLVNGVIVNSLNMPSLDKEVFERLKNYVTLTEKMGSAVSQLIDGQIEQVKITFVGDIAQNDTSILTRAALKGLFEAFLGETVNYVNAIPIANSRGIKVIEQKEDFYHEYTNLICVSVNSDKAEMEIWGTVYSGTQAKFVKFNEYFFEVDPSGIFITISNQDKPGVIGKIGTILGDNNINIAGLRLGRDQKTKLALTLVKVDSDINENVKKQLQDMEEVKSLKIMKL